MCRIVTWALADSATASDPARVSTMLIQVTLDNRELLALLDTGCEDETERKAGELLEEKQNLGINPYLWL